MNSMLKQITTESVNSTENKRQGNKREKNYDKNGLY